MAAEGRCNESEGDGRLAPPTGAVMCLGWAEAEQLSFWCPRLRHQDLGEGRRGQETEGSAEDGVQGELEMRLRVSGLPSPRKEKDLTLQKRKDLCVKIQM